nr:PEP-CTERM sorting domain-containing protein [uncultured Duganella sp.]
MMTIKFNAIHAAVLTATLAFSGAACADTFTSKAVRGAGGLVYNAGGNTFDGGTDFNIPVLNMTNTANPQDTFLAFCIEPEVTLQQRTVYTATYNAAPSNAIKALYETAYASTLGNAGNQIAFQLALWELKADDGNMYNTGGVQFFAATDGAYVGSAQAMLDNAAQHTVLSNMYSYTTFSGIGANGLKSQDLMGVSMAAPVPEASTWAMMAAGLGLVGFTARRRGGQRSAKFA